MIDDGADARGDETERHDRDPDEEDHADDVRLPAVHPIIPVPANTTYASTTSAPECNSAS